MNRAGPSLVIFTDLDGTFLDHDTYSYEEALPAWRDCVAAGVPVVFCSSKTRAEIERLRRRLGSSDPFISENGAAVFLPDGVLELGIRYERLCAVLDDLSRSLGVGVEGFHHLTPAQIAARTGLTPEDAADAAAREYDEPFVFLDTPPDRVEEFLRAVEASGLRWTRGGRFYHLFGHAGKGGAVEALLDVYRRRNPAVVSAALGDSLNDLPLLAAVDTPILVQRPGGAYDPEVTSRLPVVNRTPGVGPAGWNAAVRDLLRRLY